MVDHYFPENEDLSSVYYMAGAAVLLMIFNQIKYLNYLVPFSFAANITIVIAFIIALYYMFSDITSLDIKERSLAKPIIGLPVFFSTVAFAMEGIGKSLDISQLISETYEVAYGYHVDF